MPLQITVPDGRHFGVQLSPKILGVHLMHEICGKIGIPVSNGHSYAIYVVYNGSGSLDEFNGSPRFRRNYYLT